MRPNHPLQLQSALLARPSLLLKQGNGPAAAATTCTLALRLQQYNLPSFVRSLSSTSPIPNHSTPPQPKANAHSKSLTKRHNSTISSNPPPPSTSHQARESYRKGKVYTPASINSTSENVPIPDPTNSYAAPMDSSQTSPSASSATPSTPLTWNAFLALRKTRRRYNLLASLSTSLVTTSVGISVLAQQNIEHAGLFGLDPFIVLGLATAGSGAVGWLLGPFVGNAAFAWVHRARRPELAAKERDLYRRITLHRVDPSSSSAGNPVPDYYGEKIGSVAEYRTWLKDQRAYNKRRQTFL